MMGVEYARDEPAHYDGTSVWECVVCGIRIGRWTKRELAEGEVEWPYGIEPWKGRRRDAT